jgi:hypothetical protein
VAARIIFATQLNCVSVLFLLLLLAWLRRRLLGREAVQARGPPLAVAHVPRLATALAAVVVAALTKAERAAPVVAAAAPVEAVAALV